ncbi:MAG: alpha/beta fold hydrolase [Gammaproteobacteria bacterium]|nr:alpha/beta fold hydrolase [Gammaproteobacteria bacterium]
MLGAFFAALVGGIWLLENRPDLDLWHTVKLDEEFRAESGIDTFADYLALEERLFAQLDELVYDRIAPDDRRFALRYDRGSFADPREQPRDWNRSYELKSADPRAGVLLLHGMSDSPYSLRAIGRTLHERGATVVGMRLPGHGTAPTGLRSIEDRDLMAAAAVGMRHVRELIGNRPLYVVGYSMGGALAVDYALTALDDKELPAVAGIVLISPAIGVTAAAQFAVWQARVGYLLGLPKLEWNAIEVEYDPFKYGSFAVNAGDVVYRLTQRIRTGIKRARANDSLDRLAPILAFQSVVDATVSTPALIDGLLANLPPRNDELVIFDIDRAEGVEPFLARDPAQDIKTAMGDGGLSFGVSAITNANPGSEEIVVKQQHEGSQLKTTSPLNATWPPDIVSLSHVALPFPPNDELYGATRPSDDRLYLGDLSIRGERNLLLLPAAAQLRLRWNPFYDYLERRTVAFIGLN